MPKKAAEQVGMFFDLGCHVKIDIEKIFPECSTLEDVKKIPLPLRRELVDRYICDCIERDPEVFFQAIRNTVTDGLENIAFEYLEGYEEDEYPVLCCGDVALPVIGHGHDIAMIHDLKDGVITHVRPAVKSFTSLP